jgi:hypothetical protein
LQQRQSPGLQPHDASQGRCVPLLLQVPRNETRIVVRGLAMTFKYALCRDVPWWKFWIKGKWIVFRTDRPNYILRGFNKRRAAEFIRAINVL